MNNRINIKNLHYCTNTVGADGTVTRSTPKKIVNSMKVSVNPTIASQKLYGDGAISDEATKTTGAGISLELNKLPTDVVVEWYGKSKDKNGIIRDNKDDQTIEISLGWEVELTGGESEFIWFTRCKPQPIAKEVQQSTDSINFSTDIITLTAMPDENGDISIFGESIDPEFKCSKTWFLSCPPEEPKEN